MIENQSMQLSLKPQRRRRHGRLHRSNQLHHELQNTPKSFLAPSCDPLLKECINRVRQRSKIELARKGVAQLYGRHNAIDYRPQYEFYQSWQQTSSPQSIEKTRKSFSHLSAQGGQCFQPFVFALILGYGIVLWCLSMYRVFQMRQIVLYMALLVVILLTAEIFAREGVACWGSNLKNAYLNLQNKNRQNFFNRSHFDTGQQTCQSHCSLKQRLRKNFVWLLFLLYLIVLCLEAYVLEESTLYLLPIDLCFMVIVYRKMKTNYMRLRIRLLSSNWRYEAEIMQLVIGCLTLVHFFSIFLCLAAQTDNSLNWTLSIERFGLNWGTKYMYSLYFACSTMFTVGYGDVTPKNHLEILTILIVQVVGIINIGYVINEVGRFMQIINEGQDRLNRNISDAEKLAENYKLPQDLTGRLRSYLINNQIASNRFNVEQEEAFMKKLNEPVRQEIVNYSQLQLIKNSVFFLCHWTKKFQRSIASKLIKQVYSPNDILPQKWGEEKIYVLFRGKIDIEANFDRSFRRKSLRVLEINEERGVQFNVYGYSGLISGLHINLRAVAKDYSICYVIDKQRFMQALFESPKDFQYFHEIRSRVEESTCKQVWEAPNIKDSRQHYLPNHYFILKKQRCSKIRNLKNRRSDISRNRKKAVFVIQAENFPTEEEIQENGSRCRRLSIDSKIKIITLQDLSSFRVPEADSIVSMRLFPTMSTKRKVNVSSKWTEQQQAAFARKRQILNNSFEHLMSFGGFMVKFNYEKMIAKYNWVCCKEMDNRAELSLMTSRGFYSIPEEGLRKLLNSRTF